MDVVMHSLICFGYFVFDAFIDCKFCAFFGGNIGHLIFFSILQALYFCVPFREQLIDYYSNSKNLADAEENLLTCLADLFMQVIL
jgi:hypothetical protein